MYKLFVVFCCIVIVFTIKIRDHPNWPKEIESQCGRNNGFRIVGGKAAKKGQYPWFARIGIKDHIIVSYLCGGALVSSKYVLTAAHCVNKFNDRQAYIKLGEKFKHLTKDFKSSFCRDKSLIIQSKKIIIHQQYIPEEYIHDIALIELESRVVYNKWIKPLCLPLNEIMERNYIEKCAEIAGWGYINSTVKKMASTLQTVKVKILPISKCKMYAKLVRLGDEIMCAGGAARKDSCNGDSGGPLIMPLDSPLGPRYFALGVTTFGPKECGSAIPALYTNVSHYIYWILDHMT